MNPQASTGNVEEPVTITLEVDDKGDKADDGGLTSAGTKDITVEKPTSVSMISSKKTSDGGEVKMKVKDSVGGDFKVDGVDVLETCSSMRYYQRIDGVNSPNPVYLDPSSATDVKFTTLSADGSFTDPFILHGREAIAAGSAAETTCGLSLNFNQDYSIQIGGQTHSLFTGEGTYQRRVIYELTKETEEETDGEGNVTETITWNDSVTSFQPNVGN